ncbi:MAG: hypothetical protein ACPG7E_02890 [Marinirhabdus sp.]
MKKTAPLLFLCALLFLTSCEGDPGPPGEPGTNILGQVFETTLNFNASNDYGTLVAIPNNIEVFESDVILVYLLDSVTGQNVDVWAPLPQTFFPDNGTLLYTFDHTFVDVNIFLDANFNLNELGPEFTDNLTFRIAVVPAEFGSANPTMQQLMAAGNVEFVETPTHLND